jgi:hypothetical protein
MPTKYHADPTGRLLPCEAKVAKCPYGTHFSAASYAHIVSGRPMNDRELNAWFDLQVANSEREIKPISKRLRWGYASDFRESLLRVTGVYGAESAEVKLMHDLRERYGNPKMGSSRATFDRGDGYLIKVALVPIGQNTNRREARVAADPSSEIPMAKCWEETIDGIQVLVIEKVRIPEGLWGMNLPDWVEQVDFKQVGYNSKGELVAYDL